MSVDILVTTPKSQMVVAALEAQECLSRGGGEYFRKLATLPKGLRAGSKVFYVEDGFVRGFAVVDRVVDGEMVCSTTGTQWGAGIYAVMDASTWQWICPLPMKGFQGWRYFTKASEVRIVGDWKSPRPVTL